MPVILEVGHGDEQTGIPRKLLELDLPEPCAVAVAAARAGGDDLNNDEMCDTLSL
ncbi:MAG TPA: hypothetical protein VJN18_18050 [Polyangiaceae bacterium]|nr:hypothetical protein [Polyangiaceae bacterium]